MMTTYADPEYLLAKKLKRGECRLEPPFAELSEWIEMEFGVKVLMAEFHPATADRNNRPELTVTLEFAKDAELFHSEPMGFDPEKSRRIVAKFMKLLREKPYEGLTAERVFATFDAFEPIAKAEAGATVSDAMLEALKAKLANPDLWKIAPCYNEVTFFFFTDAQAQEARAAGLAEKYGAAYTELLRANDEFGYFTDSPIVALLDSKEVFENQYEGQWHYYYR